MDGLVRKLKRAVMGMGLSLCTILPAAALSIVPVSQCEIDPANGQVYSSGTGPAGSVPAGESTVGDGIVLWEYVTPQGLDASVIRVCRSGREMHVTYPVEAGREAWYRFGEMVFGDTPYTLQQIQSEMTSLGAVARRANNTYGNCVCNAVGY